MNNKNLPIAISYAFLNIFLFFLLLQFYFTNFLMCNTFYKISFIILSVSMLLYTLFQSLFHWITKNEKTLTVLNVLAKDTSTMLISAILLSYSFCIFSGPIKWVSFGLICLFFSICILFFSIWTKIPYFLSEIFKDINLISILIFSPNIFINLSKSGSTHAIILIIISILLYILSIVLKYVSCAKKSLQTYSIHKFLNISIVLLQFHLITHYFV